MRAALRAIWLTLTLLAAVALVACANPSPTTPTGPPLPSLTGLTITGLPAPLILGESVQLTANITLPNGVLAQTSEATWQSSDKNVATVSATGLLTGIGLGDADVTASFLNVRETAHVAVKPPVPIARLDVTIDKHGSSLALVGVSEITFEMSRSVGFGLRYDLAFGDGSSSSGSPIAKHVYTSGAKDYTAQATVTDVLGRTHTVSRTVRVISLIGFQGYWTDYRKYLRFFPPDGSRVQGEYSNHLGYEPSLQFTGTINAADDIHLVVADGTMALDGSAILNCVQTDHSYSYARHLLLTIRGGPSDGTMVDFQYQEPY